jgi:hypothetical protein
VPQLDGDENVFVKGFHLPLADQTGLSLAVLSVFSVHQSYAPYYERVRATSATRMVDT